MEQVAKYFGLEESELPAIAVHEAPSDSKFFLKNAKPGAVKKWLADYEVRTVFTGESFALITV